MWQDLSFLRPPGNPVVTTVDPNAPAKCIHGFLRAE
jgi:hypothetical protein